MYSFGTYVEIRFPEVILHPRKYLQYFGMTSKLVERLQCRETRSLCTVIFLYLLFNAKGLAFSDVGLKVNDESSLKINF